MVGTDDGHTKCRLKKFLHRLIEPPITSITRRGLSPDRTPLPCFLLLLLRLPAPFSSRSSFFPHSTMVSTRSILVFTLASTISVQAQLGGLSSSCSAAATGLLLSPFGSCVNILSLATLLGTTGSIIDPRTLISPYPRRSSWGLTEL